MAVPVEAANSAAMLTYCRFSLRPVSHFHLPSRSLIVEQSWASEWQNPRATASICVEGLQRTANVDGSRSGGSIVRPLARCPKLWKTTLSIARGRLGKGRGGGGLLKYQSDKGFSVKDGNAC